MNEEFKKWFTHEIPEGKLIYVLGLNKTVRTCYLKDGILYHRSGAKHCSMVCGWQFAE